MVRVLKKASIGNLAFAVLSAPVLHFITSQTGNGGKGVAMSTLLVFFGGSTTAALTWISGTYVYAIRTLSKDAIAIDTPTLFGGAKTTEVAWADISRPESYHPFSTFQAHGKLYYLDEDGEIHAPELLPKLEAILNAE